MIKASEITSGAQTVKKGKGGKIEEVTGIVITFLRKLLLCPPSIVPLT